MTPPPPSGVPITTLPCPWCAAKLPFRFLRVQGQVTVTPPSHTCPKADVKQEAA